MPIIVSNYGNEILILICMFLLITKHLICDFYLQTEEMVKRKGTLFDIIGFSHSAIQGAGTFICIIWFVNSFNEAIFLSIVDMILHYIIDFIKMNFGCPDIRTRKFWNHIGLDQYLHYVTYIGVLYIIFIGL